VELAGSLDRLAAMPREVLATLPTPLERGPLLPHGGRLWVKRDDLTGLGLGGNKARKLEFLCGAAIADGANCLVTVGASQSNHCRMTAAAGARLGLETHLVLSGDRPEELSGNLLLSDRFGAHLHFTGADARHWGELAVAAETLVEELANQGLRPFLIPIGGSTPVGALGYVAAYAELAAQCAALDVVPSAFVVTTSSGGTHAGLVAGRAMVRSKGASAPVVVAIGVAKGVLAGRPDAGDLARATLELLGCDDVTITAADVELHGRWLGEDYAVPTPEADAAIAWAARAGAWVLDRTYTGKGLAGLLGLIEEGRFPPGEDVVWIHTGGVPAVFVPGGSPARR
jgi:1-aminocyclopropane-1-carboxylate deaminase/D-cysteine desulfhydrase-like pyridoxal-dependent ACC family enzyme